MCTRTEAGLALEGSQVYSPESLAIAFCTSNRLLVSTPFSVTSEMPPRGESKLMSWNDNGNMEWKMRCQFHTYNSSRGQRKLTASACTASQARTFDDLLLVGWLLVTAMRPS